MKSGRLLPRGRALALWVAVAAAACTASPRSRFQPMAGHPNILEDASSGRYPHVHCQVRVPLARALPEPLTSRAHGDLLSATLITPATMTGAGIDPAKVRVAQGWRTFLWRERAWPVRQRADNRLAVKVVWPLPNGHVRPEPQEIFTLPALEAHPLYRWSPWQRAQQVRSGEHVAYQTLVNTPAAPQPLPAHPFELRCRTVLSEQIPVAIEAEDANIDADEEGRPPARR